MAQSFEARIAQFAAEVLEQSDFAGTVDEVVRFACSAVGTPHGGVTLIADRGTSFETVGGTSAEVTRADQLQYELNEGPCIRAATESELVFSSNLDTDIRWPRWGPQVSEWGFRSVISVNLHGRRQRIGALNLYGDRFEHFSAHDTETAHLFAFHASSALLRARNEETLRQALDARTLIGQAQGILMERFGLDPEQTFAVLRRYSQTENMRLNEIAHRVVTHGELPHSRAGID